LFIALHISKFFPSPRLFVVAEAVVIFAICYCKALRILLALGWWKCRMGEWECVLESGEDVRRLTDGFCVEVRRRFWRNQEADRYADIEASHSHEILRFPI